MQIRFTKTDGTYTFDDALNLPDDNTYTNEELEAMMQARFDEWVAVIVAPQDNIIEEEEADPVTTSRATLTLASIREKIKWPRITG